MPASKAYGAGKAAIYAGWQVPKNRIAHCKLMVFTAIKRKALINQ